MSKVANKGKRKRKDDNEEKQEESLAERLCRFASQARSRKGFAKARKLYDSYWETCVKEMEGVAKLGQDVTVLDFPSIIERHTARALLSLIQDRNPGLTCMMKCYHREKEFYMIFVYWKKENLKQKK